MFGQWQERRTPFPEFEKRIAILVCATAGVAAKIHDNVRMKAARAVFITALQALCLNRDHCVTMMRTIQTTQVLTPAYSSWKDSMLSDEESTAGIFVEVVLVAGFLV